MSCQNVLSRPFYSITPLSFEVIDESFQEGVRKVGRGKTDRVRPLLNSRYVAANDILVSINGISATG